MHAAQAMPNVLPSPACRPTRWITLACAFVVLLTLTVRTLSVLPAMDGGSSTAMSGDAALLVERVTMLRAKIKYEAVKINELLGGMRGGAATASSSPLVAQTRVVAGGRLQSGGLSTTPSQPAAGLSFISVKDSFLTGSTTCALWKCDCQTMSDKFRVDHFNKYWGDVSEDNVFARKWWGKNGCHTAPAKVQAKVVASIPSTLGRGTLPAGLLTGAAAELVLRNLQAPPSVGPIRFVPGTLPTMPKRESLHMCRVNTDRFKEHFQPRRRLFASIAASRHNLTLFPVEKSGSSTVRHIMEKAFGASETFSFDPTTSVSNHIAFVRKPLSRFYSQYDEMFVREAPWEKNAQNRMPPSVRGYNAEITSYENYMSVFCNQTMADLAASRPLREMCQQQASAEDGTLARLIDTFLAAWDGLSVFDTHLRLQVRVDFETRLPLPPPSPSPITLALALTLTLVACMQSAVLSDSATGKLYRIDELHDIANSDIAWRSIAPRHGVDDAAISKSLIRGRSYPRRFNKSKVSDESVRRVCRYAALDYCCLNFEMPKQCRDGAAGVTCEIEIDAANGGERHIVPVVDESIDALAAVRSGTRRRMILRRRRRLAAAVHT